MSSIQGLGAEDGIRYIFTGLDSLVHCMIDAVHAFKSIWSWVAFQSRPTARALSDSSWNALWQQVCLDFSACVPHTGLRSIDLSLKLYVECPG